ncbi:MAG TPA: SH3 domain-containing protein [Candidatus Methylomirabilis sp.]|nr:SH3 domain-containing protein [Candidatus Methylomirabilis sp.]
MLLAHFRLPAAEAADALILGSNVPILQAPRVTAATVKLAQPGESYEVIGRKTGKGQPLYILDERGNLWMKVQVSDDMPGYLRTDGVSVAREEFGSPKGNPLLIVNLRPTADGTVVRELWWIQEGWQRTRRLAIIEGRPTWAGNGEWFMCQVDSERPIKDQTVDRTVERIDRFSADGRSRNTLSAGSYPILNEARGEVYFYRDVDEQGEAVRPGLFTVSVAGNNLHPLFLLPEGYRFWKEDGDYFVQAPSPTLHPSTNRISLYAFDRKGKRARFTITLEGHLVELLSD